jgi:hypothetical protein
MKALTASMASIGPSAGRVHEGEVEPFSKGLGRGSTSALHTTVGRVQPGCHQAEEHQREGTQDLFEESMHLWAVDQVLDDGRNNCRDASIARIIGRFGGDPVLWARESGVSVIS